MKRSEGKPLADLIGKAMETACRKRGFATADLVACWPDIVGDKYAARTRPDSLNWPRPRGESTSEGAVEPATLVIATDGPTALFIQHEVPQIMERINMFFGWAAVGRIRIVQKPIQVERTKQRRQPRALTSEEEAALRGSLGHLENDKLRVALEKLGRAVKGYRAAE